MSEARTEAAASGTDLHCLDPAGRAVAGAEVGVMVRPEWFVVDEAEGDGADALEPGLTLVGEVRVRSSLGAFGRAWVEVAGMSEPLVIEATLRHPDQLAAGTRVRVHVPHERAVVVDRAPT